MEPLGELWNRAIHPSAGFRDRARKAPGLGQAVGQMLVLRSPVAFLGLILSFVSFSALYARLKDPASELWTTILQQAPDLAEPRDLKLTLERLPDLPSLHGMLPGLLLLAPLLILSLWLHDVAFDHLGLWLLRGLKGPRSLRLTLVADAEALKVGVIGAAAALLADLPRAGWVLTALLVPVAVYFWVLRGYALAAWHGCPPWKGVVATILNVVLAGAMILVILIACVVMVVLIV